MKIDINRILENKIPIDIDVIFDAELASPDVLDLKNTHASGYVKRGFDDKINLYLHITGLMTLNDSISLEEIDYKFDIELEEIFMDDDPQYFTNSKNTLDIIPIIWQNIVLEVPIAFSNATDDKIIKAGEGWQLVDKKDRKQESSPFAGLLDEEKE